MNVVVETARPADAKAVGQILSGWIDETAWIPRVHSHEDEQGFAAMLIERGWTSVARIDGETVGFLARDGGEVHALYLSPPVRGRAIGKALLDRARAECNALGLWTFQANTGAQRFFLREGFREVRRSNGEGNDEGLPDIRYEWERAAT